MRVQYNIQKNIQDIEPFYADYNLACRVGWENGIVYVRMSKLAPNGIDLVTSSRSWTNEDQVKFLANDKLFEAALDEMKDEIDGRE